MQFGNLKTTRWISVLSVLLVSMVILSCFVAQAAPVTLTNDTQFKDTSGNVIHAHGGGMIKVGSTYYLFGECRQSGGYLFDSVKCYSSTDLKTWTFVRNALSRSSASELNTCNIERPKVMYCPNTGQYVMWMHWENGTDYGQARCAVAYSSTVDGPYTYQGSFRPYQDQGVTDHGKPGYMSRDCSVFVDGNTGYFISAANENMDLHLYQLTSDFRNISTLAAKLFVGSQREAPCLFKRGSYYFLLTSGCTGWTPNQAKYSYSTSLTSGWSGLVNIGSSTTYNSQPTYVIPVSGSSATTYLYLGDHWGDSFGSKPNDSKYTWLPLTFGTNTSMSMSYNTNTTIDTTTGVITLGSTPTPGTGGWTKVDDTHSSVSYSSGWGSYADNPSYQYSEHYSETTGSVATFTFTGTQARYYGYKRNDLGYAEISVDDVVKASVDCYSSSAIYDTLLYETAVLASGTHTLKIKVAGTKNGSSSGTEIICDAFEYTGGSSATPTPTLAVTPTPTPSRTSTPSRTATPRRTATPGRTATPVRTATPRATTTPQITPPPVTPPPVTPTPGQETPPPGAIKIQLYNQSTAATTNQVYLNIRLVNTGSSPVALSNVKLRYYYTVDGAKAQTFYSDYTPLGSANVNGTFVTMATSMTGADTYLEIGFTSGAGSLAAGANTTIQARFAKSDWSNYTQTNDYSFNSSGTAYMDWTKVTGYISGALQWGVEP